MSFEQVEFCELLEFCLLTLNKVSLLWSKNRKRGMYPCRQILFAWPVSGSARLCDYPYLNLPIVLKAHCSVSQWHFQKFQKLLPHAFELQMVGLPLWTDRSQCRERRPSLVQMLKWSLVELRLVACCRGFGHCSTVKAAPSPVESPVVCLGTETVPRVARWCCVKRGR